MKSTVPCFGDPRTTPRLPPHGGTAKCSQQSTSFKLTSSFQNMSNTATKTATYIWSRLKLTNKQASPSIMRPSRSKKLKVHLLLYTVVQGLPAESAASAAYPAPLRKRDGSSFSGEHDAVTPAPRAKGLPGCSPPRCAPAGRYPRGHLH